jgi:hypothetical protein
MSIIGTRIIVKTHTNIYTLNTYKHTQIYNNNTHHSHTTVNTNYIQTLHTHCMYLNRWPESWPRCVWDSWRPSCIPDGRRWTRPCETRSGVWNGRGKGLLILSGRRGKLNWYKHNILLNIDNNENWSGLNLDTQDIKSVEYNCNTGLDWIFALWIRCCSCITQNKHTDIQSTDLPRNFLARMTWIRKIVRRIALILNKKIFHYFWGYIRTNCN